MTDVYILLCLLFLPIEAYYHSRWPISFLCLHNCHCAWCFVYKTSPLSPSVCSIYLPRASRLSRRIIVSSASESIHIQLIHTHYLLKAIPVIMVGYKIFAVALALCTLSLASPITSRQAPISLTGAQLQAIAPHSNTCAGADPAQCQTADHAAGYIAQSFQTYGITSPREMAALISTIAFESGDFKYNKPINPTPGKGTRNMQSAAFNDKYAQSLPQIASQLATAPAGPDAALNLLIANPDIDFASAAWFLTTQCPSARAELQSGTMAGYTTYITGCLSTAVTDDRHAYALRAYQAMGVPMQ
jgi:hypothetical protein